MSEKYKPSPEEEAKAEGMMVEEQQVLTRYRERLAKNLESIGKKGHVSLVGEKGEDGNRIIDKHRMVGEVNGHKLDLTVNDMPPHTDVQLDRITADKITGTVDGEEVSAEDALKLYKKYRDFAEGANFNHEYERGRVNEELDREAEKFRQDNIKRGPARKTVDELLA